MRNAVLIVSPDKKVPEIQKAIIEAKEKLGEETPVIHITDDYKTNRANAEKFLKMVNGGSKVIGIMQGSSELNAASQLHRYTKKSLPDEQIDLNKWDYQFYPHLSFECKNIKTGETQYFPRSKQSAMVQPHIQW